MKKLNHIVTLFLSLVVVMLTNVTTFASESSMISSENSWQKTLVEAQPRIGYAAHYSFSFDGKRVSKTFSFKTSSILFPSQKWSLKTTNFPSNSRIGCVLLDANYIPICDEVDLRGNQYIQNMKLTKNFEANKAYFLLVNVYKDENHQDVSVPGNFEIWLY